MLKVISMHLKGLLKILSCRPFTCHTRRHYASSTLEEKIIKSPSPFIQMPKGNFVKLLFKDVRKWETETAMECAETGKTISFAELIEQSERWSGFLRKMGVSKGDVVTIISPNCLQYGPVTIGTASIGAALSPMNWKATPEEIRRTVGVTEPKMLIFSNETEENVVQALTGQNKSIILLSIGKPRQKSTIVVDEILDGLQPVQPSPVEELTGEEIIYMPFSSGTTGPPKAVALSHNAWIAAILQLTNPYHELCLKPDVTVGMLPFFHIYGMLGILLLGVHKGNKMVVVRKFNPKFFLNTIIKHKLMKGYVNNPAETRAILKDGWAHTGDIGFYDSDGFFSIVDRTKDLIKVHGMQVSPSEIEDELLKHGSVAECSVIGVPDERTGEAPKAFIVLKEKATVEDLNQFLEPRLSKHKQLRGGITFVESLPKSETGKVLRKILKTLV